jgi:hypothetical protein
LKKIVLITTILLLLTAGCSVIEEPEVVSTQTQAQVSSPAVAATELPTQTTEPIETPIATTEPEPTPLPEGYVRVADGFCYYELTDKIIERITGMSYPAQGSSKISYEDLRYIELLYYDFDGNVKQGELIVNKKVADEVTVIFNELFYEHYPFESVRLVDDYGEPGDDNFSMAANNTSAFNYRYVTGSNKLSLHSYGAAIDINPVQNPYIDGDRVVPEEGREYLDRSLKLPGMIDHGDICYQLFTMNGWKWGGDWSGDKDYQHFSKDLGF